MRLRSFVKRFLRRVGYDVRRTPSEPELIEESIEQLHSNLREWLESELSRRTLECAMHYYSFSKSEFLQDIFALAALREKRNGFFVEFGAGDGMKGSNTYMLEKEFGWSGILAEPNRTLYPKISANRSCVVDGRCVWSSTGGSVAFTETSDCAELSTISQFSQSDCWDRSKNAIQYQVATVSLNDLLDQHHAPTEIDYLSIDTEGSELTILRALDLSRWRFNVITAEHNWVRSARDGIHALLTPHGYRRVMTGISQVENWYVRTPL